MPSKKNKLKKILGILAPDETSVDFATFDQEVARLKDSLKEKIQVQTLEDVKKQLEKFQNKIDLQPLLESLQKIKEAAEDTSYVDNAISSATKEVKELISTGNLEINQRTVELSEAIQEVKGNIDASDVSKKLERENILNDIKKISDVQSGLSESLRSFSNNISLIENTISSDKVKGEQEIKDLGDKLETLRKELLNRINNIGGGSMNRQIKVGGTDVLTRYTDINLVAGNNITITTANDNTDKNVDFTFNVATSGGGAFTEGSVIFAGAGGLLAQDNSNFFWDDTNNQLKLGNGTAALPSYSSVNFPTTGFFFSASLMRLSIAGTEALQFTRSGAHGRVGGVGGSYIEFGSTGYTTITSTGASQNINIDPSATGRVIVHQATDAAGNGFAVFNIAAGGSFTAWCDSSNRARLDGSSSGNSPILLNGAGAGNILLRTTVDSGAVLNIGTNTTTTAGGMIFGTDFNFYRSGTSVVTLKGATGQLVIESSTGTNPAYIRFGNTGGQVLIGIEASSGGGLLAGSTGYAGVIVAPSTRVLQFGSSGTLALTLDASQDATFVGEITQNGGANNAIHTLTDGSNNLVVRFQNVNHGNAGTIGWENASGRALSFLTQDTVALTIDTSQNATFAGATTQLPTNGILQFGGTDASISGTSGGQSLVLRHGNSSGLRTYFQNSAVLFGANSGDNVLDAGAVQVANNNIAATSTAGLSLFNRTAATVGTQVQMSGRLAFAGSAWKSDATAESQTQRFFIENLPVAGAASTSATLKFGHINNGAAATYPMTLSSAGALTIGTSFTAGNSIYATSGHYLGFTTRALLSSPADSVFTLSANSGTGSVSLDFATVGTLKVRNAANNADADITSGSITGSAKIIFNGTTTSSGAGAVGITGSIHEITTTGTGDALTLADGTEGQRLTIVYVAEGAGTDTAVLTPTNFGSGTTITFSVIGQSARLIFTNGKWYADGAPFGAVIA